MEDTPLISSLRAAVDAAPDDVPLRLHLAALLADAGNGQEAVRHAAAALQREPGNDEARTLMARAMGTPIPGAASDDAEPASERPPPNRDGRFDWHAAEEELSDVVPPMFVDDDAATDPAEPAYDVERPGIKLADVGGMDAVKKRLEAAFLAPLRNPELRRAYGKSLRGGLLLYGPPGCGKTFLARAVAGELGAKFLAVGLNDVVDMWIGRSERNLHEVFETARRSAPCVLFLDELDALGQKRANLRNNAMRSTVNQLLLELDDVGSSNEGVFVLAATNHPWDVDSALRRPGRLDRTMLVLPPDAEARAHILRHHLAGRPVGGVNAGKLAKRTDGYSGADLAHVCEVATERALLDSATSGEVRMIGQDDLEAALTEVRPSTGPWFETARNVAMFANEGGTYDDLLAYLKKRRMV